MIFIGGEAGVGKSTLAKYLQEKTIGISVFDKDETTSVFASYLLKTNGYPTYDRESSFYIENVKPLEYEQLDNLCIHTIGASSLIVTAPYFDSFLDDDWIERMRFEAEFNDSELYMFYMVKNSEDILQGLKNRNESRDIWKISNYSKYRKDIDIIISKMLKKEEIKIIDANKPFYYREIEEIL